jgi:adenosylcobinamide-phosphate synthase
VTLAVAALAAGAGLAITTLGHVLGLAGVAVEALALSTLFSIRGLWRAARRVERALDAGDLPAARIAVGEDLVSRPTGALDEAHVASATIESLAENLSDSVLAPLAFYLAFGLAGAAVYRAVNTADTMIGYRAGVLEHFGKAAARLDDVLNLVPARLSALAIVAVAPAAWRALRRDHAKTASPNAGWPMAAMAGALGVTLEKPGAYRLGDGPFPNRADIARARRLVGLVAAAATVTMLALAALSAAADVI